MNVTILDDDPLQHLIMEKMVNRYTHDHVMHSSDGGSLINILNQNRDNYNDLPDVIIMDIHMPAMNGWEFLNHFKKIRQTLNKPVEVYILSSSIDPNDISHSKRYSFVKDYIIKPISSEKLKKILDHPQN